MSRDWPHAFAQIAALIGDEAAEKLAAEFGGREVYVPRELSGDHRLVALIGLEAAGALAREYGRGKIHPPVPRQRRATKREIARAEGSLSEIAKRFGVTRRWVAMVKNGR